MFVKHSTWSVIKYILLSKLQSYGFTGDLLAWFKSYLNNRLHCVRLEGHVSSKLLVKSSVPQGSILGPILFILYINDLFPCFLHSHFTIFADDSECLKELTSPQDGILLHLDLDLMVKWCNHSHLMFNVSKCALLRFGSEISPPHYTVYGELIPFCMSHKNLGALITNDLSWSPHISSILAKAYRALSLIKRVVPSSSSVTLKRSLYLILVRCHLVYCSPAWRSHLLSDSRRLESVQSRATQFVFS